MYVAGTSQGGVLTFAFAARSTVAAKVEGIICFNSWVELESRQPTTPAFNKVNNKWNIFTWSGEADTHFAYTKTTGPGGLFVNEFNAWGFTSTVLNGITPTKYDFSLGQKWDVSTRASINSQVDKQHKDISTEGLHAMANWFNLMQ